MAFLTTRNRHIVKRQKPKGYSDTSVSTYYTEEEGMDLLPILQSLLVEPRVVVFNSLKRKAKPRTLHINLSDAWRWLIDHHVDKEKWAALRARYEIKTEGLLVKFLPSSKPQSISQAAEFEDVPPDDYEETLNWKKAVLTYIDSAPDGSKPLEIKNLHLKEQELDQLSILFAKIDEKLAVITLKPSHIKIVKNAELAKKLKERGE